MNNPQHDPQDWQKALDRIEQARADGGKSVDLSGLKIQDIPDELLALAPTLERLNLNDTPITDAAPLEGLTNLTTLSLSHTQITDAAPLEGLTNLTTLSLSHTQITDAAPLAGLTNLTTLGLSNTQITTAAPLEGLTNLTELDLSDTQITDAAPLERLTNLTALDLYGTQITTAAPLQGLTNLTTLGLSRTPITDAAPLAGLTNLTTLVLGRTQITDAAPLERLTNLTTLYLNGTDITDATPLEGLTNLTRLDLDGTDISDAAPLERLTNLTTLGLSNTQITTAAPLEGLTYLKQLYLGGTQITDAAPLEGLTNLTTLYLGGTQITDAAPLERLTNLTRLYLGGTQITDAAPLERLTNLTRLYLGGTQITDAAPLQGLTNLTKLDLDRTQITDAAPLQGLINLTTLYLGGTQITDARPLAALTRLNTLDVDKTPIIDLRPIRTLTALTTGGGPPNLGLSFQGCAATHFDAPLNRLSQIKGHEERTEKTLEYLRGLDDAEYDRRLAQYQGKPAKEKDWDEIPILRAALNDFEQRPDTAGPFYPRPTIKETPDKDQTYHDLIDNLYTSTQGLLEHIDEQRASDHRANATLADARLYIKLYHRGVEKSEINPRHLSQNAEAIEALINDEYATSSLSVGMLSFLKSFCAEHQELMRYFKRQTIEHYEFTQSDKELVEIGNNAILPILQAIKEAPTDILSAEVHDMAEEFEELNTQRSNSFDQRHQLSPREKNQIESHVGTLMRMKLRIENALNRIKVEIQNAPLACSAALTALIDKIAPLIERLISHFNVLW